MQVAGLQGENCSTAGRAEGGPEATGRAVSFGETRVRGTVEARAGHSVVHLAAVTNDQLQHELRDATSGRTYWQKQAAELGKELQILDTEQVQLKERIAALAKEKEKLVKHAARDRRTAERECTAQISAKQRGGAEARKFRGCTHRSCSRG